MSYDDQRFFIKFSVCDHLGDDVVKPGHIKLITGKEMFEAGLIPAHTGDAHAMVSMYMADASMAYNVARALTSLSQHNYVKPKRQASTGISIATVVAQVAETMAYIQDLGNPRK